MTTGTQRRAREPRRLAGDERRGGVAGPRRPRFDAHRWYERYTASHPDTDSPDVLSGVPFS